MASRYAAFLRGMNVGGRRLTNDELRSCLTDMGFRDVECFRASGNVVFDGDRRPAAAVKTRIEQGLAVSLGYAVPTWPSSAVLVTGNWPCHMLQRHRPRGVSSSPHG